MRGIHDLGWRARRQKCADVVVKAADHNAIENLLARSQRDAFGVNSPVVGARGVSGLVLEVVLVVLIAAHMQDVVRPQLVDPIQDANI